MEGGPPVRNYSVFMDIRFDTTGAYELHSLLVVKEEQNIIPAFQLTRGTNQSAYGSI
jgi:hypothetical protein